MRQLYYKVGQVSQSGATTITKSGRGNSIKKMGSSYIDQNYIKESVRKIYCLPPYLSFANLTQLRMEKNVYKTNVAWELKR